MKAMYYEILVCVTVGEDCQYRQHACTLSHIPIGRSTDPWRRYAKILVLIELNKQLMTSVRAAYILAVFLGEPHACRRKSDHLYLMWDCLLVLTLLYN